MGLDVRIQKKLNHFRLDVDFSCGDNQLLAIVGPSGAGKTIIIRTIAGLEKADSGYIANNGKILLNTNENINVPPRKRGIGYVFQDFTLFPNLNVYKNVLFAARDHNMVKNLMEYMGIWHLKDSKPHMISGGERQRCAICQALAREPQLLLMDEPFSALDAVTRRKLRDMMKMLKIDLTIPIIHVTHDIREARLLADTIVSVVEGRINNKWMMQFIIAKNNMCRETNYPHTNEDSSDVELPYITKEYII